MTRTSILTAIVVLTFAGVGVGQPPPPGGGATASASIAGVLPGPQPNKIEMTIGWANCTNATRLDWTISKKIGQGMYAGVETGFQTPINPNGGYPILRSGTAFTWKSGDTINVTLTISTAGGPIASIQSADFVVP